MTLEDVGNIGELVGATGPERSKLLKNSASSPSPARPSAGFSIGVAGGGTVFQVEQPSSYRISTPSPSRLRKASSGWTW